MRRARKVDKSQSAIVKAFRACGASVEVLSDVGRGVPDLLVGFRGRNWLIEVKEPGEGLTLSQMVWHEKWQGRTFIVRGVDDVPVVLKQMTKRMIKSADIINLYRKHDPA